MQPELGVIEGYFGPGWSDADRRQVIAALGPLGYAFFHYAPKADAFLRRRWREPFPDAALAQLAGLAAHCRHVGMRFGVGLSPYELYRGFSGAAKNDFVAKLRALDALGLDELVILFDDTRGDVPELPAREVEIVHEAAATTHVGRIAMCPTYYSDDRVLDVVFGQRPAGYLEELGHRLDARIGVYWTGPEVCTREFSPGHLRRVAESLRRKPMLWDNYPVNDGPRMSRFLHLRGFTGRRAGIGECIAAHAINPAMQAHLSLIPAATLAASYRAGADYCYMQAFREAATALAGEALAHMLEADLLALQDTGLERLDEKRGLLRARYAAVDHPMAREVVRWLDGAFTAANWELETG